MATFVIVDPWLNKLHHVVDDAADAEEALIKFDKEVGVSGREGLDSERWNAVEVTPEQLREVQVWARAGASPEDVPDFLKL